MCGAASGRTTVAHLRKKLVDSEIDDERIWDALKEAQLDEFVREQPDGLDCRIGDRGVKLSGGQRQRIGIARALYTQPQILVLDEATSALDNITQKKVTEALDNLKCTRIVIAHRLSTIKSCSRILYLGEGRVLEEGTYEELMEKKGLFAEMVERQQI